MDPARGARRCWLYLPGLALLAIHLGFVYGWLRTAAPLLEMRWLLDRVWLGFLCAMYLAGGAVLAFQMRRADDPVVRRQLTWLRNGALVGIVPFALIYAVPYLMGVAPNHAMNLAVLSLPLIPLTWAYAILRYRLMDVDIIFQEGYVYTLATLVRAGDFLRRDFLGQRHRRTERYGDGGADPDRRVRIPADPQMDSGTARPLLFYKDRYDYRRTLIEFARELGSPTDMRRDARKRRGPADPHAGHPARGVFRVG